MPMLMGGKPKSGAMAHFDKVVASKKAMAKKMKRGPYDHHAKPAPKTPPKSSEDWIKKQLGNW